MSKADLTVRARIETHRRHNEALGEIDRLFVIRTLEEIPDCVANPVMVADMNLDLFLVKLAQSIRREIGLSKNDPFEMNLPNKFFQTKDRDQQRDLLFDALDRRYKELDDESLTEDAGE